MRVLAQCLGPACSGGRRGCDPPPPSPQRIGYRSDLRVHLLAAVLSIGLACSPSPANAEDLATMEGLPPAPLEGNCPECLGEVRSTLNQCPFGQASCVSSLNEDEAHFYAPWENDNLSLEDAVARVITVAEGGPYQGVVDAPYGRDRGDVARFILQGTAAVSTNRPDLFPQRPTVRKAETYAPFPGTLVDRHVTDDNSIYLRFLFVPGMVPAPSPEPGVVPDDGPRPLPGSEPAVQLSSPVDVELVFIANDNLVTARASSRGDPAVGRLGLSFTNLIEYDRNEARTLLERLRRAVGFGVAPVVTDFDPTFASERQLWFEQFFEGQRKQVLPGDGRIELK